MRILKKSLAICLAAILALTAMCGCIVSADTTTTTGTISAGKVNVTVGETEVTVPVTITSASPIVVVRLAVEAGLTLKGASATAVDAEGNPVAMKNIVEDTDANLAEGIIIFDANDWNVPFTTATANLVYDVSAAKAGDVYDITPYALTTVEGSTYDEIGVVYTYEAGSITVESAECAHVAGEAVKENEVAADCDDAGSYDNVVYCSVCGEEMSRETVTVDALGHTEAEAVVENEVVADCDTEGSYDSVIYCSVCGEEISRVGVVVPATGEHTAAEAVVENEEAADCANAGSYDSVVYCSVCNTEISRETITVDATGEHNYVDGACSVCGAEDPNATPEETIDDLFPISISYDAATFKLSCVMQFTKALKDSVALTEYVEENYGALASVGLLVNTNGEVPTIDNAAGTYEQTAVAGSTNFKVNGMNFGYTMSYSGMNISQFADDCKYVGFVGYTDANGDKQYVYTTAIGGKFIDYISASATEGSLESKLVKAYEDTQTGFGVTGTYATSEQAYTPLSIAYDLDAFKVSGVMQFTKTLKDSVALTEYVEENYGALASVGLLVNTNGVAPTIDTAAGIYEQTAVAGSTNFKVNGMNFGYTMSYSGMNINQLGDDCYFVLFAGYTDGDGAKQYAYLETINVSMIDILRGVEGNEAVANLIDVYDTINQ